LEFDGQEGHNVGVPKPLGQAIAAEVPGVAKVVPVAADYKEQVTIPQVQGEPKTFKSPDCLVKTNRSYFDLLPYHWLAGNPKQALEAPNKVVLTQSRAEKYFPKMAMEDIIGKTLIYNDTVSMEVSGIVKDLGFPTSFYGKEFLPLPIDYPMQSDWGSTSSNDKLYVMLDQHNQQALIQQKIDAISRKNTAVLFQKWRFSRKQELIPITDMHFTVEYGESNVHKANKPVLMGLIGVAAFLLLLAIINFVNLSTAQLPQKAKEIGVRKTMGSPRQQLIMQFLAETFIICLLAGLLSLFLTYLFNFSFKDLLPENMDEYTRYDQLGYFLVLFLIVTTILAGGYPAWVITKVNPIQTLRNQMAVHIGRASFSLRKALIVFQFVIAMLFIVSAIIVGQQLTYTLNKDLGFNKEAVLLVNIPWKKVRKDKGTKFTLLQELRALKGIKEVAMGSAPLSSSFNSSNYDYRPTDTVQKKELQLYIKNIGEHYLSLYQMKLLAGRDLAPSDTVQEYLINETAMRSLGFKNPQEAIGQFIGEQDRPSYPIAGVIRDFHDGNFYKAIDPLVLLTRKQDLSTYNIKLDPHHTENWQAIIKAIEKRWQAFYPEDSFEYKFYDRQIGELYEQEHQMSRIINLATAVAILISCLGLLGLVTLTAYQRTKEIGIRKVLGASVVGIVQLLSKDFLKLVLLAIVIASPLAWWAMQKWLQGFAYRVDIHWWVFVSAGVTAILIALITLSFQAIKAAVANPVKSLRNE